MYIEFNFLNQDLETLVFFRFQFHMAIELTQNDFLKYSKNVLYLTIAYTNYLCMSKCAASRATVLHIGYLYVCLYMLCYAMVYYI